MIKKLIGGLSILLLTMLVACSPESTELASPSVTANPDSTPGAHVVPSGTIGCKEIPDIVSQFGSSIEIKLTFTNYDSTARVMRDFPPMITVVSRNLPFADNVVRTFTAGKEQLELRPGESKEYILHWDQKNDSGQQVPYGWYDVRVNLYSREITDTRTTQGSGSRVTRVLVFPQGGAMEKSIELNQSRTAKDITVNLEKLEMQASGAALYLKLKPENYQPAEDSEWETGTEAQYKLDNEDWKQAHKTEFGTYLLEDGVRYIWDLDPVPQNSQKLTFRITRLGTVEGLWEFEIPLESGLPFEASMNTSPIRFLPGEDIRYGISIRNLTSNKLTIYPFPPAMSIKLVSQDEVAYSREAGNRTQDIETDYPNSWYHTKGVWDQKDNQGKQVAPGWYEISYEYAIIEQTTGKRYTAKPATKFEVVNPDSTMNKELEVNQSVASEGVTVTLKSLEMNAVETKIYTFTTPPVYSLPQEHAPYELGSLITNSMAECSVDGGEPNQVKSGGGKADTEGITLTWDNLDPMPLDAKELTFIITQLGDQKGRWEFKVKLN